MSGSTEVVLHDKINYFYFVFVDQLQRIFERLNVLFQQCYTNQYFFAEELQTHRNSSYKWRHKKDGACIIIECMDFGMKFDQEVSYYLIGFTVLLRRKRKIVKRNVLNLGFNSCSKMV